MVFKTSPRLLEMDQPLEVGKDPVVDDPDVVEAQVDGLEGLEAVEAVARQVLHQVIAQVQVSECAEEEGGG